MSGGDEDVADGMCSCDFDEESVWEDCCFRGESDDGLERNSRYFCPFTRSLEGVNNSWSRAGRLDRRIGIS